jgi:sec-independent protein translocase protein TatA
MRPAFAFLLDGPMFLILGVLAVLLFGARLPEVARTFGKGMMEFKKGLRGIQDEIRGAIDSAVSTDVSAPSHDDPYAASYADPSAARYEEPEDREEPTAPKFEPPPAP